MNVLHYSMYQLPKKTKLSTVYKAKQSTVGNRRRPPP